MPEKEQHLFPHRLKVLIIQVGNPVDKTKLDAGVNYFHYPSLIEGQVYFDEKQIINNVQTRQGIADLDCEVIFYFHTRRKRFTDIIRSSLAIRKLVQIHQPEITHVYWGGISGFFAVLFCPGKTVVSLLGSDLFGSYYPNGRKILSSRIQTLASRLTGFIASRVIVMSSRMKKYMWNRNSKRIVVIPEGLSFNKFYPGDKKEAREYLQWKQDVFIVIFFYEGQAVKNPSLAHEAFNRFKKSHPEAELKIISGYNHDELVNVYRAADCLLMTSFHEGSNNSLKEALACNLPVISVPCGDAEERLNPVHNSFVSTYDPNDMVKYLEEVYKNDCRSNGAEYIYMVSIPFCSREILNLYNDLKK